MHIFQVQGEETNVLATVSFYVLLSTKTYIVIFSFEMDLIEIWREV